MANCAVFHVGFRRGQVLILASLTLLLSGSLAAGRIHAQTDLAAQVTACEEAEMASKSIHGGQLAVMRDGEMLYERAFGRKHRDRSDPVDNGTMFRIGSTTKTLTAFAMMQLVDDGRLALDAPITTYLQDFELAEPSQAEAITIRHLLTHSSGLHDTSAMSEQDFWGTQEPGAMRAWVNRQRGQQPYAPPGRFWNYSSGNYMYAGQILERITGETYQDYMDDHVFEPAGMADTTMHAAEGVARGNFAYGHYRSPFSGQLEIYTIDDANNWARHPTGYANATAGDLVRFANLMMAAGDDLLSSESVAAMSSKMQHRDQRIDQYYGLGTFVEFFDGNEMVHHDGGAWGWTATMKWIPEAGVAVATTSNTASAMMQDSTSCALRAYVRPGPNRSNPCRLARSRWDDFVGTYHGSDNSAVPWTFEITRPGGGNLQMRLIREGVEDRVEVLNQDCNRWVNSGSGSFGVPGIGEITFIEDPVEPGVVWLRNRFFVAAKRREKADSYVLYFPMIQKEHDSDGNPNNRTPTVSAGTDRIIELPSGKPQVAVNLEGSATDPDAGDHIVLYEWSGSPDPDDIANPDVLLGLGTHTFELRAYDNHYESASDSVTITVVADLPGVTSGTEWRTWGFTPTSETVIGTITASPNNDRLHGVIGFFNGETRSLDQAAVQVRFNPDGEIDAFDGTTYRAIKQLRYELGKVYDFRIIVNVPKQSFDVYVTPEDEAPVLVARDFAFNPTAAPSDQISHIGIVSETGSFQGRQFVTEFHTAYERVTPKTVYAWFPDTPGGDAVVNVSPTPGDGWYGTADIHPDGTDMIFHGAAWGYARIWKYTFATKEITPLTSQTFVAVEPAYSADGNSIVFTSDKDLGAPRFDMVEVGRTRPDEDGFQGGYTSAANLYVMDADGQNLRQLTSGSSHVDKRGSFSPDGETVVFLSSRGASTLYMWTVPSDSSLPPTKVKMVDSPWVGRPRYSPDGEVIYFFSGIKDGAYDPNGRHTLCRVPVDGVDWSTLPNDTLGIGSHGPAPDPSGEYLWYHAFVDGLWGVYKLPLGGGAAIRFKPPGFDFLHIAHATEASNGNVAFDSRSYVETR